MALVLFFGLMWVLAEARAKVLLTASSTGGWEATLRAVEERARGGRVPVAADALAGDDLVDLLRRMQRRGRPLLAGLDAARRELRSARELARERRALWRLYWGRLGVALGCALAVRIGILGPWALPTRVDDQVAVGLAAVLAGVGCFALPRALPGLWLLDGVPFALPWIEAYIGARTDGSMPWSAATRAIDRRALRTGVCGESEVRAVLSDWARTEGESARGKLKRLEEISPLWELLTIGLPAALVLLVPMLDALGVRGV